MKLLKRINFLSRFILKQRDFEQYVKYKSVLGKKRRRETLKKSIREAISKLLANAGDVPIVLVLGYGSFGDSIQITPLLYALKHRFEEARLIFMHSGRMPSKVLESASVLYKCVPMGDSIDLGVSAFLLRQHIDLTVEWRYVVKYMLGVKPRLSQEEISFIRAAQEEQQPWLEYIVKHPTNSDRLWRAAAKRGWSMYDVMAHTSGFSNLDFETLRLELPCNLDVCEKFNLPSSYLVVSNFAEPLNVRSNLWTKCLPHKKMQETLARLTDLGITTVLVGTASDPGVYAVSYDLRGKTTLFELAAILQKACLVLGPEGGLVNLARAMGKRSVVFFGATPASFFGFKGNINIEPTECGGCWHTTESYLGQCPLLLEVPACTNSIDPQRLVAAVQLVLKS